MEKIKKLANVSEWSILSVYVLGIHEPVVELYKPHSTPTTRPDRIFRPTVKKTDTHIHSSETHPKLAQTQSM